jgi:oligoendopeptidase F
MKERSQIEQKYLWNFTDIYTDKSQLDEDLALCAELTAKMGNYRGRLGESAEVLADAMDTMTGALEKLERASCYAFLQYAVDGGNSEAQMMMGKTQTAGVNLMTAVSYMEPEILEIPEETLQTYLATPRLATYRHY